MTQSILITGMARCLPNIKTDSVFITLVVWVSFALAERNPSQKFVVNSPNASQNESINSGHLKTEDGTFQACEMCLDRDLQGQCLTMSKGSAQQVYSLQKTKRYLVNYKKWNAVCQNWNLFSISWTFRKWEFLFFMLDHVSSILPKAERLQIRQHLWKCAIMWY